MENNYEVLEDLLATGKPEAFLIQNSRSFMIDLYARARKREEVDGTKTLYNSIERIYDSERLNAALELGLLEKVGHNYVLTQKGKKLAEEFIKTSTEIFMGNHPEYRELFKEFRPDRFE
jgi:hypothetical protein